jgi:hypothetical protein
VLEGAGLTVAFTGGAAGHKKEYGTAVACRSNCCSRAVGTVIKSLAWLGRLALHFSFFFSCAFLFFFLLFLLCSSASELELTVELAEVLLAVLLLELLGLGLLVVFFFLGFFLSFFSSLLYFGGGGPSACGAGKALGNSHSGSSGINLGLGGSS